MFQVHNVVVLPVEMVGDEGYLLDKLLVRVADESSPGASTSTSNACWHCGAAGRQPARLQMVDLVIEILEVREVGRVKALNRFRVDMGEAAEPA